MINARQVRAARALLNWNQTQLSEKSGVARSSIKNIENEITAPRRDTAAAIQDTFEDHGVEFLPNSGTRMKETNVDVLYDNEGLYKLFDDCYETCLKTNSEILISGNAELSPDEEEPYKKLQEHIERLKNAGIKQRILAEEGDQNFVNSWSSYRWLPKENFYSTPMLMYADKLAIFVWGPPRVVTIIQNPQYAKSFEALFNFAWDRAQIPSEKRSKKK